jgi:hypothetical protein
VLIENESQWNTEDLRAIVAAVMKHENKTDADFAADFLIVFKTCRKHSYSRHNRIRAAQTGGYRGGLGKGARTVEIRSKNKLLEKNVLDRLAQAAVTDVPQDIHPKHIRDIAVVVKAALEGGWSNADEERGYEWAEKLQLRAAPKITRSHEVTKRKILGIEAEKERLNRCWAREVELLDAKIARLRGTLPTGVM